MFNEDYNIQYMGLKYKVQMLKIILSERKNSEKNIDALVSIDLLAKELDSRYIDAQYLDDIEIKIDSLLKKLRASSKINNLNLYSK